MRHLILSIAILLGLAACEDPTYVLVGVETDPSITEDIAELRFTALLQDGTQVRGSDERGIDNDGDPMVLPSSFVVLADGWGGNGESVFVNVEAIGFDGESIARARGEATLVSGEEVTVQLILKRSCNDASDVSVCLGGQAFCDAPHQCNCEGEECLQGFCEAIPEDDNNPCTEYQCDELAQVVSQDPIDEGMECGVGGEGQQLFCGQGFCKEPVCGDFIIDAAGNEECDEGSDNSDTESGACRTSCKLPSCGDGVVDVGAAFGIVFAEECDEGANNVTVEDGTENETVGADACRQSVTLEDGSGTVLTCATARCGDGIVDTGERCDDHDSVNGDGCNPTCSLFGDVSIVQGQAGGPGDRDDIGTDARLQDPLDFAVSGSNVYFTSGGGRQVIREWNTQTDEVRTVAGVLGQSGDVVGAGDIAQFSEPHGLAAIGTDLFIVDHGNNRIKKLDLTTLEVSQVAGSGEFGTDDGPAATATFKSPEYIVAKSATELLVMDTIDNCNLRLIDLVAETVSTVNAGVQCFAFFPNSFGQIGGMAMADDGSLFVSERAFQQIKRVTFDPVVIQVIAGGPDEAGSADGNGVDARFFEPEGLAVQGDTLFVADRGNDLIRQIDTSTADFVVSTLQIGGGLDAPKTIASIGQELFIGEGGGSAILGADTADDPIVAVERAGKRANKGFVNDDNGDAAIDGLFGGPQGITLLGDTLLVADGENESVRSIDLSNGTPNLDTLAAPFDPGLAVDVATDGTRVFAIFDGSGVGTFIEIDPVTGAETGLGSFALQFDEPRRLEILGNHAYVVDQIRHAIRRIDLTTGEEELYTGDPNAQPAVVDGSRFVALFAEPFEIVACNGDLYVGETTGNRKSNVVRKIDFSQDPEIVTTLAGLPTAPGFQDGPGLAARFDGPEGLACDERNPDQPILYIADSRNAVIRQMDLVTGDVSTLAGVPFQSGVVEGVGDEAGFGSPRGLHFDETSGDLYVSDAAENVILRIE